MRQGLADRAVSAGCRRAAATGRSARPVALIAAALVVSGCASPAVTPAPRTTTGAVPSLPSPAPPEDRGEAADVTRDRQPEPSPRSGATTALLAESRDERDSGDLAAAAATIERALSIAPDDALLWIELGEIRLEQGDRGAAAEMGRKAMTLTRGDDLLEARARRLVGR